MRNKMILLLLLFICTNVIAAEVELPTTYQTGGTVTASNLNGNYTAITAQINGGLDNDNADTASGFRFFETKSSLPANGTQGRVVYDTSDNTLNFDNGSAWLPAVAPSGTLATGKIPYYNSGWTLLTPGTQDYALISNGVSSLPSYQQVSLSAGVTGTLPVANGGSGQATANAALNAFLPSQTSNANKILVTDGSNTSWTSSLASLTTTGNVGVGSALPGTKLDVAGNLRIVDGTLIVKQTTAPTINSCGVGAAVTAGSTDLVGTAQVGNNSTTGSCAIDFNSTKTATPFCFCELTTSGDAITCAGSTTQVTITEIAGGNFAANANFRWFCPVPNG